MNICSVYLFYYNISDNTILKDITWVDVGGLITDYFNINFECMCKFNYLIMDDFVS